MSGKTVAVRFDGGSLASDPGLLALRDVKERLDVARRLAGYVDDPCDPSRTQHTGLQASCASRMLMITSGGEDGIDANALRADLLFRMALERLPGERDLYSQLIISRLENLRDRRMLLQMGRPMIELYCAWWIQPRSATG